MTIRQISEAAGCHIDTVRKIARPMYPEVKSTGRGMAIDYDKEQSIRIMERLPKRNMVNPLNNQVPVMEESSLTKKDLEMIGAIVANVMVNMESRVSNIEQRISEKVALLPPPPKDPRKELTQLVREYAQKCLDNDYRKAWNNLYKDFYYRLDLKVKKEAELWDCKPVEWLEKTDHLNEAIAIIKELMNE